MADKKPAPDPIEYPKVTIKFKDMFVFKDLYGLMYFWLKQEGWIDKHSQGSVDYIEEFYLEKVGSTGAKDHIIYWELEKPVDDYFKYSLSILISTIFLNATEMMYEGRKVKVDVGDLKLEIVARLHLDRKAEWINSPIFGPFYKMIQDRVFKKDISYHKKEVYKQLYEFQAEIKRYLKLKQHVSAEGFIPEKEV